MLALTSDVYPFFSASNPNAYAGHASQAFIDQCRLQVLTGKVPWMMGQSFQDDLINFL